MPKPKEMSKQGDSSVQMLKNTALKNLCLLYLNKVITGWAPNLPKALLKAKSSPPTKDNTINRIQAVIFSLPPTERLVLVLREVLGRSYVEIANMIGMEKTTVPQLLNTGLTMSARFVILCGFTWKKNGLIGLGFYYPSQEE